MLLLAPGLKELAGTASSKELLGAPGIATSKDATTGSWPTRSKDTTTDSWPEGTTRHC